MAQNTDNSQAGQSRFFETALQPHLAAAYNFARWMVRDHHDAEDIVQESFVKALGAAGTFRGVDARPWLFAIVRNSAINFMKRGRRREVDGAEVPEPADPAPDAETTLADRQRRQQVRSAIACLPLEFREALLLREMEGMAYKEIAAVLKVPMGTVMSRLSRARQLLIQELKQQGLLPGKETIE
jgi:RNA polymerase sigma-70 factor (ECF subfamily)